MGEVIRIQKRGQSGVIQPKGIAYKSIPYSGTKISYNTYDEYWQLTNGVLNRTPPLNPAQVAELDYDSAEPFYTLKNNNALGNLERFTNTSGIKSVLGDTYAIDHLYGVGIGLVGLSIDTQPNQIIAGQGATLEGFSNYYLASIAITHTYKSYNEVSALISIFNLPFALCHSSTHRPLSSNVMVESTVGQVAQLSPASSYTGIIWRKHY